jgi:hypothetical protein
MKHYKHLLIAIAGLMLLASTPALLRAQSLEQQQAEWDKRQAKVGKQEAKRLRRQQEYETRVQRYAAYLRWRNEHPEEAAYEDHQNALRQQRADYMRRMGACLMSNQSPYFGVALGQCAQ